MAKAKKTEPIEHPHAELYPWHLALWQQLSDSIKSNRLPHALLISGTSGLGKDNLAAYIAQSLACQSPKEDGGACGGCQSCHLSKSGVHPDIHWVQPESAGKAIKIAAVRQLTEKTGLTANGTAHRVFVVTPADAMNNASANALLKTLEEPPARSVIILVSPHPERLSATIRSRCQQMHIDTPNKDSISTWMQGAIDPSQLDSLLAVTAFSPLHLKRAILEDWLKRGDAVIAQLSELKSRHINPMRARENWEQVPFEHLVEDLERCLSDMVKVAAGSTRNLFYIDNAKAFEALVTGIDLVQLHQFIDTLHKLRNQLSNNVNISMLLEKLIIEWLQISKPRAR